MTVGGFAKGVLKVLAGTALFGGLILLCGGESSDGDENYSSDSEYDDWWEYNMWMWDDLDDREENDIDEE